MFTKILKVEDNEVVVEMNNTDKAEKVETKKKHQPNDIATDAQRRYCYRIMKSMIEKKIVFPREITGYYIYNLMTFKEAYIFIQRYKEYCI